MEFSQLLNEAITKPGVISSAYSAFHNYSLGNQMAALSQCTERGIPVGAIASFKAWQDKGRNVIKGSKAISLCMPVTMKGEKTDKATGEAQEVTFSRFLWKNNWFVVSQTEGADFAPELKIAAWDKSKALAALDITEIDFAMVNGNCQGYAAGRTIAVNPIAALPHKTRFHEMAHIVLGHTSEGAAMHDNERTPKDTREVEAESVAYILCSILGLPGLAESRGYVQSWLNTETISEKSAQKIFSTADKILKAGA